MLAAAELGVTRGLMPAADRDALAALITQMGPLPPVADLEASQVVEAIGRDKKIVAGALHFVLPGSIGTTHIATDVTSAELHARARVGVGGGWTASTTQRRNSHSAMELVVVFGVSREALFEAMFLQLPEKRLVGEAEDIRGAEPVLLGLAQRLLDLPAFDLRGGATGHVSERAGKVELGPRVRRRRR